MPAAPAGWRRLVRRFDRIFLFTVALPTLVAAVYYGAIASDIYVSESRFLVRSPQKQTSTSGLGALLAGTSLATSRDDAYSVHDYVLSRDALAELQRRLKIREVFSNGRIDFVNRFPGLSIDDSFEALFRYYTDHVAVNYDTASGITTLSVQAYSAADARAINEALLQTSERVVNTLEEHSRRDLIEFAQREVDRAEQVSKAAALAVAAFRSRGAVYDPERQSGLELDNVMRLREELRLSEAQLAQLRQVAPANPQVEVLTAQVKRLRDAIGAGTSQVVGSGARTLNALSPEFQRLLLDREFADRQLSSALASLENARAEAARKQLYLERLVQPSLPDASLEPRRVRSTLAVLLTGLILWGVVSLLVAGVREHGD